ncbi:MAG: hypothetical protein J5736_02730 [Bacilli bacterium]|nr:hypothetical protein [Bacilli bacterium]
MNEEKDIKIGRVNRGVEKALRLSLASDVSVWMKEEDLNKLAKEKPETYLKTIEGIQEILKCPDFVSYRDEEDALFYVKDFFRNGRFRKVLVVLRHEGTPKCWVFSRLSILSQESLLSLSEGYHFVRFTK